MPDVRQEIPVHVQPDTIPTNVSSLRNPKPNIDESDGDIWIKYFPVTCNLYLFTFSNGKGVDGWLCCFFIITGILVIGVCEGLISIFLFLA